jgi:hypothetical protein
MLWISSKKHNHVTQCKDNLLDNSEMQQYRWLHTNMASSQNPQDSFFIIGCAFFS